MKRFLKLCLLFSTSINGLHAGEGIKFKYLASSSLITETEKKFSSASLKKNISVNIVFYRRIDSPESISLKNDGNLQFKIEKQKIKLLVEIFEGKNIVKAAIIEPHGDDEIQLADSVEKKIRNELSRFMN